MQQSEIEDARGLAESRAVVRPDSDKIGGQPNPVKGELGTALERNYRTLDNRGKVNERKLAHFLARNGQQLLPLVELIEQSRLA